MDFHTVQTGFHSPQMDFHNPQTGGGTSCRRNKWAVRGCNPLWPDFRGKFPVDVLLHDSAPICFSTLAQFGE